MKLLQIWGAAVAVGLMMVSAALAAPSAVVIPWGDWLAGVGSAVGDLIAVALLAALTALAARLPGPIAAIILSARAEQLLERAVGYGVNAVAGAAKGRALTVDVGSEVLAEAARYAIAQAPGLVARLGGAEALRRMIFARLNLDADASAAGVMGRAA
jgi:hypothetical protein